MTVRALIAVGACALLLAGSAGAGTPNAKRGYHVYGENCLRCHGANAGGRSGTAPSLHGVGALAADFYLRTGYMPLLHEGEQPRRRRQLLSDVDVKALVAYVASFGGPPVPTPHPERGNLSEGAQLFTERCSGCHQIVARGGYAGEAVAEPLNDPGIDATTIAEAVRVGPYVMPKFTDKDLSDRQLDSVVRYVLAAQKPATPGGWGIGFIGPVPEGLVTWFVALPILIGFCILLGRRLRT